MSPTQTDNAEKSSKKEYFIDLKKIYEIQPNQDWAPETKGGRTSLSLHQNLAAKLTRSIWNAVLDNDLSSTTNWVRGWSNLNYFISGERGSGKSTFLRYVTRCITGKDNPFEDEQPNPPTIEKLFFCDPTAMKSNENFFISIVAALNDWIRKQTKKSATDGERYTPLGTYAPQKEKLFADHIKTLAQGIRQLNDGRSSSSSEMDATSQLSLGMANSSRAFGLKAQFDNLINDISIAYSVKAFLIAIDDADIEFTKNKLIIEIIRTYLTHPRLIILFTGDTILTHEAIREKQFQQFGLPFHQADIVNQKRRWDLTDAMTAQYIKKIFPPSNHLHLTSLHDTIRESKGYQFTVGYDPQNERQKEELKPFLKRLFLCTLDGNDERVELLMEGFLRLPLRSIMHTLRYWGDRQVFDILSELSPLLQEKQKLQSEEWELREKINELKKQKKPEEEKMPLQKKLEACLDAQKPADSLKEKISRMLAKSFRSAFNDELLSLGFSKADLEMATPYQLSRGLLLHCFNSKDISYGHRLVISACRHDNQESTFFLAAQEAVIAKNFSAALSFALFGVFTIHAYRYYQQTSLVKDVQPNIGSYDLTKVQQYLRHKQQGFEDYLFSSKNEDPLRWTRKLSLIFLVHNGQKSSENEPPAPLPLYLSRGVYYLSNRTDIELVNQILKERAERITELVAQKHESEETKEDALRDAFQVYFVLLLSCGQASNHQNVYYLSAYNIFGFILKCCEICEKKAPESEDAHAWKKTRLMEFIKGFLIPFAKANDIPTWGGAFPVPKDCGDIHPTLLDESEAMACIGILINDILTWHGESDEFTHPCAFELGQAADTIYQSICNLCNAVLSDTRNSSSSHNPTPLRDVCKQLYIHLSGHSGGFQKPEPGSLLHRISKFPLCQNLDKLCQNIMQVADQVVQKALDASNLTSWLRKQDEQFTQNRDEINQLKQSIGNYFAHLRHSWDGLSPATPLLFCDNVEETIKSSQSINQHFERINENLKTCDEILHRYEEKKKSSDVSNPGDYFALEQHIKVNRQQYNGIAENIQSFRLTIRQAFEEALCMELAAIQESFRQEREKILNILNNLFRDIQKGTTFELEAKRGGFRPGALHSAAQTTMKYYVEWKINLEKLNTLRDATNDKIIRLRDDPYMLELCKELNLEKNDYGTIFRESKNFIQKAPEGDYLKLKDLFHQFGDELQNNLSLMRDFLVTAKEGYHKRLLRTDPLRFTKNRSSLSYVQENIRDELHRFEESLYKLRGMFRCEMKGNEYEKYAPHPSLHLDFVSDFGLNQRFYDIYLTLYEVQHFVNEFELPSTPPQE